MKPVLVIEQEPLLAGVGVLGQRLDALGLPYRRLRAWEEDLSGLHARDFSGLVPLGGARHAWQDDPDLREELRLLDEALEQDVPVLGICLGGQLLARALGAEVAPGGSDEIGWIDIAPTPEATGDPLLRHLSRPTGVYQWHEDGFELPEGAALLATNARYPCQAFRYGAAWGVQFHPEVDFELFEVWFANHPGAAAARGFDEDQLRESVRRGSSDQASWAFRAGLFDAFARYAAGWDE